MEKWESPYELDKLKDEMIDLLTEYDLFYDTYIYVNGKRYSPDFYHPGEVIVEDDMDPGDYFEYVRSSGNIFSMSFEGPLNHVLNGYVDGYDKFLEEFEQLFTDYDLYYEFGHHWNLSCYPV